MEKVLIIAEAGVNHNGDIEIAKSLIDAAAESKADYVKFQTFVAKANISKSAPKAEYQFNTTSSTETQLEMVSKLELNEEQHFILLEHCAKKNIRFLSTAFDFWSIDLLAKMGLDVFKIPSGEITNLSYLRKIAALQKRIIISTGMATLGEIEKAIEIFLQYGISREMICILHCNTEYPTPFCDVNLRAMITMRDAFKVKVGYSDHTIGIEVPIAAVALGATVIEKHFTLNRNMLGPDHKASLEPVELQQMVLSIRNIELAMGNGIKLPSESEKKNLHIARKSLHTAKPIKKNEILSAENIISKRPGDGISPMEIDDLLGKKVLFDLPEDHKLAYSDFI